MSLRFVIDQRDENSSEPLGLFQALYDLLHDGRLSREERRRARGVLDWFDENLQEPKRLSCSSKRSAQAVAISWFKPSAHECIGRMQELVGILYAHDLPTRVVKTRRPGYIVYEDDLQVVAQAFSAGK